MSDIELQKELRFKNGSKILRYITRFSATEKAVFGALVAMMAVTAFAMAARVSDIFKIEVPATGGELREGMTGLPRTINPILAITDVDRDLSSLVYSGLMKYENGVLVPDAARSFTVSKDGLTYDFKLREDAKFQDGIPLTAADVEFTVQKIQNSSLKSPRRADWTDVTVNKISLYEIQFILKQPYSPFLANATVGIMPKHIWEKVTDDQFIFSQYNLQPVGSGPYEYASITRDSEGIPTQYKLKIFNDYYGKKPHLASLVFNLFSDQDKALTALESGNIDSLAAVPPGKVAEINSDSKQAREAGAVLESPLPRVFGVFMNQNQSAVLGDKVVRQALDMVVDRNAIINSILYGYGVSLSGPLPPEFQNIIGTSSSPRQRADGEDDSSIIVSAQALLEKDGWRKGIDGVYGKKTAKIATTTLSFNLYTADSDDLKQVAQSLKEIWAKLGANVGVKTFNGSDLYQNIIRTRKYDALLFGEQIGKDRDLYAFWHSSQRNAPGLNISMYANSKVDKILEDIRSTNDDGKRADDYARLDSLIRADVPAIFLYSPSFTYVIPKGLKGVSLDSVTAPSDRFNSIADWYLKTEKVWKVFINK